ncbi:MAG: hypothetical protein ABJJ44_18695 [Paraglaciecola sp.]|uniref:hypothetical protein n=1 Tax=Paraglaciecola sp. TaxID=1920173 RepID=UPI0032979E53
MEFKTLEPALTEGETIEIVHIEFDIETLTITVRIDGDKLDVVFKTPNGYRVLDEGDLLEFWPSCSSNVGWLHEIIDGGWLSQERMRPGFISSKDAELNEYFVIGCNYCANVLAWEAPDVSESIR